MDIALLAGSANPALAQTMAADLDVPLSPVKAERFPDSEYHVEIADTVRGKQVCIVQSTSPPVTDHLFELLLLADACWRAGAAEVTALVPYFGYARQDRRATGREPVTARLVAELIRVAGVSRLVAVDVHTPAIEGFFGLPVEHLSATALLAPSLGIPKGVAHVVVAPDLGAVKLAERYATMLGLPMAIVHKHRLSTEEVRVRGVVGAVAGLTPVIVDDMITTGGTVHAAAQAVLAAGCTPAITVAATHGVFVGQALERLRELPLARLVVTDSVPPPEEAAAGLSIPLRVCRLGPLLAEAVRRLHAGRSLSDLIAHA